MKNCRSVADGQPGGIKHTKASRAKCGAGKAGACRQSDMNQTCECRQNSAAVKGKWRERLMGLSEGLSILLSMILITVIVLFSVGVTTLVIDSTRQASNVKEGTTAYYAAEAGLEQALWINKKLTDNNQALGAEESGTIPSVGGGTASVNFDIQGTTEYLLEKTVNGKYIIPFPWTGNVPWTGEGAITGPGGCDPQKPPTRTGDGTQKIFSYKYVAADGKEYTATAEEQYHPCNWNKLAVGEKATIPLYGVGTNGTQNFTSFTLRLRTPCAFGNEMCPLEGSQRLELNCFDKGEDAIRCRASYDVDKQRKFGEVLLAWQIDAKDSAGNMVTMMPNQKKSLTGDPYHAGEDSQLFEGRLNQSIDTSIFTGYFYEFLLQTKYGKELGATDKSLISAFLGRTDLSQPVLKLSVVGDLIGCYGNDGKGTECNFSYDSPTYESGEINTNYRGVHKIPYIEYQVVLPSEAATNLPVSPQNIITAEGQSGPFVQSIQVKAPHDDSGLEYVIQQ